MSDGRSETLSALRGHYWRAQAKLTVAAVALPSSVADAIRGALRADGVRLDRLDPGGDLGGASDSTWFGIARITWEDIAAQMAIMGEAIPSWSRFVDEVITPTVGTVVEGTKVAVPSVLLVVGLVAAAYLVFVGGGRRLA